MIKTVIDSLGIVAVAAIVAFGVNYVSPRGIALVGEWDTSRGVVSAKARNSVVDHGIEIDTVAAAKKIYDMGTAVFVDARPSEVYSEGHISGAFSLPVYEYEDVVERFIENFPPPMAVVTYCSGRECEDSHTLARYLRDEGYLPVRVFADGYPAWKEEGFPVE